MSRVFLASVALFVLVPALSSAKNPLQNLQVKAEAGYDYAVCELVVMGALADHQGLAEAERSLTTGGPFRSLARLGLVRNGRRIVNPETGFPVDTAKLIQLSRVVAKGSPALRKVLVSAGRVVVQSRIVTALSWQTRLLTQRVHGQNQQVAAKARELQRLVAQGNALNQSLAGKVARAKALMELAKTPNRVTKDQLMAAQREVQRVQTRLHNTQTRTRQLQAAQLPDPETTRRLVELNRELVQLRATAGRLDRLHQAKGVKGGA